MRDLSIADRHVRIRGPERLDDGRVLGEPRWARSGPGPVRGSPVTAAEGDRGICTPAELRPWVDAAVRALVPDRTASRPDGRRIEA